MAELLKTITELPVADILVKDRLRPVSDAGVEALRASMRETGGRIKDPIDVRKVPHRGGEYHLLDGGHRLAATIAEGLETVPVKVWKCNDDFARLIELDGNLAGAELTALDTAIFLAERKRVYEKLHPDTKQGVAGAKARHGATDTMSVAAFSTTTAEKFGMSDRHVRRLVAAGERLDGRDVQLLRKAPRPITLKDLMEVSKIEETGERYHVVEALSEGKAKSAAQARRGWKAERGGAPTPANPTEHAFTRLSDAWKRTPKPARARFLEVFAEQIQTELQELVDGMSEGDDA